MVLRFILLLLTTSLFAQYPRMTMVRYTGTGADNEREVYTQIDQEITMVVVTHILPNSIPNLVHPDFLYVRVDACDDFAGTHSTGADADSICFFNADGNSGSTPGITPKGIKRWEGDTVIVGKHLNRLDTSYVMWAISDPADSFLVTGIYTGTGAASRTISTGAADSLYGLMVMPGAQNASQAHFAMWSYGNANRQYFGERGADIENITNNTFDVLEGVLAKMNTNTEWYSYFGVTKDASFIQTYNYAGSSSANSADTLLFDRTGYLPFLAFGLTFSSGSVTQGVVGSGALGASRDTIWYCTSTTGCDKVVGVGVADIQKIVPDSMIILNGGRLDSDALNVKIFMMGDTAFYSPAAAATVNTRRQPCDGNLEINDKGNIQWIEKY
jgi:hypothetical protein